ncbi:ATP-binding protein [Pendulispora albinea]|uniref:Tetratricopeptide repeat protein n=1 Tax=Pendulispora albinea TaxID=2741071 RepID=A0ABZ2MBZ8_9BACT
MMHAGENVPSLPLRGDAFVGRKREIETLHRLFSGGERLVTLTGPAGIGKTRLAMEYAAAKARAGASGPSSISVLFCDVSEAREPGEMAAAIGRALRALPTAPKKMAGPVQVTRAGTELAALGRALVVLDGFEQLVPEGANVLSSWSSLAPRAAFLVTSRELLRLPGENVLEISSLGLPTSVEAESEALDLVLDRLQRVRVGYVPTPEDARALASLVRELDGFPLAIELAAARMSMLSPSVLLQRLAARFDVLRRASGDPRARHAALETSLDDSWALLDPAERAALAQCAVFVGGFVLASAEAIVDLSSVPGAPPVLDVLQRLREKSLLHVQSQGDPISGERLGLYRSIRDYAQIRLDGSEMAKGAYARHAKHYISQAEARDHALRAAERENVVWAVERLLSAERPTVENAILAIRGAYAMETLLYSQGSFPKGAGPIERALSVLEANDVDPVWRARAKYLRANAKPSEERGSELADVLEGARRRGDRALEARVLRSLGSVDGRKGRLDTALRGLSRAHETGRDAGDRLVEAITLQSMGNVARELGRFPEAEGHYERALSLCQEFRDVGREASVLADVAFLRVELGQLEGARADCVRALGLHPNFGNGAHWVLALIYHEQGELERAARAYEHAVHVAREARDGAKESVALAYLALLRHEQGDSRTAQSHLLPLPSAARALGYARHEALFLGFLGAVQSALDSAESAQRSFDLAASALAPGDRYAVALHVLRAHADLALARGALRAGNAAAARGHRVAAEARLVDAPAAFDSYVLRLAQRLVSRAFPDDLPAQAAGMSPPALRVERGGRWLYTPAGERFEVDAHRVVRALLCALVEERIRAPGVALSPSVLCDAGWPGERVVPSAAKNRLHVSLTRLRKLGLRDLILRREDGYLLDPRVVVMWTSS